MIEEVYENTKIATNGSEISPFSLFSDVINIDKLSSNNENIKFEPILDRSILAKGDCIDLLGKINESSVDLVLTDPPYNLGNFMHKRNTNLVKMRENQFAYAGWDNLSQEEWEEQMDKFLRESARILKKGGALLIFMSLMKVETIVKLASKYKFYYKTTGVWHKTNPMPRNMNIHFVNSTEGWIYFINNDTSGTFNNEGKVVHDFFESSLTTTKEKGFGKHPTQKPTKLISHLIKHLSNINDVVVDPFMGSGTTGVSSKRLNRRFIGIDLDNDYYELSKSRIVNG
ncbi:DNA-methyltransferase [Lentiprolixibacter aurantiacus]|uniref:Methyltransferase n=1 Tax=Lentiprolixibacter aurantiacus TaxID=2993939 RepID=A0AAE3MJU5_9FLAO|nr:site-specific DNA-methyltransferase [Lentiprolixibacter aurantiacus]MCX2718759.1 site-specific DNA-methyltransferase [Lentiprolixibacter aurantiacus]